MTEKVQGEWFRGDTLDEFHRPRGGEFCFRPNRSKRERLEPYYDWDLRELQEHLQRMRDDMAIIREHIDNVAQFFEAQRSLSEGDA